MDVGIVQDGRDRPVNAIAGGRPDAHLVVDSGYDRSVLNIKIIDSHGVDVSEEPTDQETDLLQVFGHSIEWWNWPTKRPRDG